MQNNNSLNASEANLHAMDYWQVLKNRYGLIILTFILVLLTAAVITYVMPKKYKSETLIQINQKGLIVDGVRAETGRSKMTGAFFENEFEVIKSKKILKSAVEDMGLARKWSMTADQAVAKLKGVIETRRKRGTELTYISIEDTEREHVKGVVASIAKAYEKYRINEEIERIKLARKQVQKKYNEQLDKEKDYFAKVKKLATQLGLPIGSLKSGNNLNPMDQLLNSANRELIESKKNLLDIQELVKQLDSLDDETLVRAVVAKGRTEGLIVKDDLAQLDRLKEAVGTYLAGGLGPRHPKVKQINSSITDVNKRIVRSTALIRSELKDNLELAKKAVTIRQETYNNAKQKRSEHASDLVKLDEAMIDWEREKARSLELRENMGTIERADGLSIKPIKILEEPEEPEADAYVSPNWVLNMALGAVAGLVFGVGIAFALEFMDTSVKSLEDVERYLEVPVLAVIPRDVGVLHKQAGASPDAEAYRILRTNIEFNRKNPDDNAITVVSGGAGEGKSTTMVNLAYICAQGGYSTLMIDADLRRPRLHTFFDINNTVGLTNYLTTDLMLEDVILQTPVDNLFFMPSGILPADAAGILNSRRMSELVQDVKQRFDLVLIDSPPILGVSDASVLSSEVDLTMIVVQHRKLPRNMLMRVKQAVENVGGTVLGVVLNNVDVRSDSQYQYYTSYYTYYAPSELDRDNTTNAPALEGTTSQSRPEPSVSEPSSKNNDDLY